MNHEFDWQLRADFISWGQFQETIKKDGRADDLSLETAIAYIITHELKHEFGDRREQRFDLYAFAAEAAYDWYRKATVSTVMTNRNRELTQLKKIVSHDPATHYRALRFVIMASVAVDGGA
ncbi:MAG: hypothetical protein IK099_10390 [Clostridia bacterium]|nr:hypothetical protein [Clostridia bacterium]